MHDASLVLRFLNTLRKNGRSVNTLSAYRNDINLFMEFLHQNQMNPEDYQSQEEWLHFLKQKGRNSHASVRRALMSIRSFFHFLVQEKMLAAAPSLDWKSPVQPKHDLLIVTNKHFQEIKNALFKEAQTKNPRGVRDLVLFLLLGEYGLKATEAAVLTWGDVTLNTLNLKGQRARNLEISSELTVALEDLRTLRKELHLSIHPQDFIFYSIKTNTHEQVSDGFHRHSLKSAVYTFCQRTVSTPYNAESLRNYAIKTLMESQKSPEALARFAGYASLNSLERFHRQYIRGSRRKTT